MEPETESMMKEMKSKRKRPNFSRLKTKTIYKIRIMSEKRYIINILLLEHIRWHAIANPHALEEIKW